MSRLTQADCGRLADACAAHAADIASDLEASLGLDGATIRCDAIAWSADALPSEFDGPGLAIAFDLGDALDPQQAVFLLPQTAGAPDWMASPSGSQSTRLAATARDWASWLFPPELAVAAIHVVGAVKLREPLQCGDPPDGALVVRFLRQGESGTESPILALVAPLPTPAYFADQPQLGLAPKSSSPSAVIPDSRHEQPRFGPSDEPSSGELESGGFVVPDATDPLAAEDVARELEARARVRRLLKLPVTVTVRLAEKRIELKQLLAIGPGALITFNKPCEELLDLYVNNCRYCRGEAVKIGEKFGLKIEEVGVEEVRVSKVV